MVGSIGLFFSFVAGRSGDASRGPIAEGLDSCSATGTPTDTGADEPVNQELSPPFDLSNPRIVSPVKVGIEPGSCSSFSSAGKCRGLAEFVCMLRARNDSSAVNER